MLFPLLFACNIQDEDDDDDENLLKKTGKVNETKGNSLRANLYR